MAFVSKVFSHRCFTNVHALVGVGALVDITAHNAIVVQKAPTHAEARDCCTSVPITCCMPEPSNSCGCCAGAILTKMDGDSRGGAALSVRAVSGKPIKFVGAGEKLEALEPFYPDRLTSRILGKHSVCCSHMLQSGAGAS